MKRVSIETASVPAIDMSAIMQLAESDDMGDQFVTEIIDVFLTDLGERVTQNRLADEPGRPRRNCRDRARYQGQLRPFWRGQPD